MNDLWEFINIRVNPKTGIRSIKVEMSLIFEFMKIVLNPLLEIEHQSALILKLRLETKTRYITEEIPYLDRHEGMQLAEL